MAIDKISFQEENDSNDKTPLLSDGEIVSDLDYSDDPFSITASIDEIVDNLKIGLFHYLIVILCGICYGGYSVYYQSMGLIIITACDLNINATNKGWLSVSFMIGMVASSILFGRLADVYGRRKLFLIAIFINLISILASAFTYDYTMLVIMANLAGNSYGAICSIVHSYVLEFFPRRYRGIAGTSVSGFIILGSIYSCALALVTLPNPFHFRIGFIYFTNWRFYLLITIIPTLIAFCILLFMPDSLRFALSKNDKKSALLVLDKIDQINSCFGCYRQSTFEQSYSIKSIINQIDIDTNTIKTRQDQQNYFIHHVRKLMKKPWRKRLMLLSITWWGYCFSDQGFLIWLPTVLSYYVSGKTCRMDQHNTIHNSSLHITHNVSAHTLNCYNSDNLKVIILNLLIGNALCIPLTLICILFINRAGRKLLYCLMGFMCGLSILLMWLIDSRLSTAILSCFFTSFTAAAWIPGKTWSSELFCTEIRSTAIGLLNFIGHIGSITGMTTFVLLFHVNCTATFLIFGVLGLFAVIITLFLPDTTNSDIG